MALVKTKLKQDLKDKILGIEDILKTALEDKDKGIYKALENIDKVLSKNVPTKNFDVEAYKKKMWETMSKEWSISLSKQIIDTLSKELSTIISDLMTDYIKSATITIPAGQVVSTVGSATAQTGATTAISPEATIN